MKHYSVHTTPPEGFHAMIETSGCFLSCAGKLLYLRRHPEKPYGNFWGIPAGKLEAGESPLNAVLREIKEEIGIDLDTGTLKSHGTLYCRLDGLDFTFHVFSSDYLEPPHLQIALEEHLEALWVTRDDALKLPLITGAAEILEYYLEKREI